MCNTNAEEVISELLKEAIKAVKSLKSAVNDLEGVLERRKHGDAIAYAWIENVSKHFEKVTGEVCRINGAILVRGTEKWEE